MNWIPLPTETIVEKIPLQMTAKDESLDVWHYGSENLSQYLGLAGVEPLDTYLNDPAMTPADWDYADIAPSIQSACQKDGKTYCITTRSGGGVLYYNKKMYEEAGITAPPNTPAELLDYAKRLTTEDHAGFCATAGQNRVGYPFFVSAGQ